MKTFIHSHLSYPNHQPSFINFLDSLYAQPLSRSCLVYLLVWNLPLHTPRISSPNLYLLFCNTRPHHCYLFCSSTEIMSDIPSLSPLYFEIYLYLNVTHPSDHSYLYPLKWHLIFFFYRLGLTSMQHTTSQTTKNGLLLNPFKTKAVVFKTASRIWSADITGDVKVAGWLQKLKELQAKLTPSRTVDSRPLESQ